MLCDLVSLGAIDWTGSSLAVLPVREVPGLLVDGLQRIGPPGTTVRVVDALNNQSEHLWAEEADELRARGIVRRGPRRLMNRFGPTYTLVDPVSRDRLVSQLRQEIAAGTRQSPTHEGILLAVWACQCAEYALSETDLTDHTVLEPLDLRMRSDSFAQAARDEILGVMRLPNIGS